MIPLIIGWIKVLGLSLLKKSHRVLINSGISLYEGGVLNKSELIKELKTYVLVDQYLFHTEKS